jgi:hypothetical protein
MDSFTALPAAACEPADGLSPTTVPGVPEVPTGSVCATNPVASTWPAADAASCPTTSGIAALADFAVVVVAARVVGVFTTCTGWPFEIRSVTELPWGSCDPPPGDCETTIPRGLTEAPMIALTL